MYYRLMLTLITMIFLISCGTAQKKPEGSHAQLLTKPLVDKLIKSEPSSKPKWLSARSGSKKGKFFYFIGESTSRRTKDDAVKAAFLAALSEVSMYFGVEVESQMKDLQVESNGQYNYFVGQKNIVTGKPITLRNPQDDKSYVERWRRNGETRFDAKVLVSVPKEEIERLDKEIKALSGWGIIVNNNEMKKQLIHFIKNYAKRKNQKIVPDETPISSDYTIDDLVHKSPTAFFYRLTIVNNVETLDNGKIKVILNFILEHLSLIDKTVLMTKSQKVEVEAQTEKEAIMNAVKEVLKKIQITKVGTEKQVSISPALNLSFLGKPACASFSIIEYMNFMDGGVKKIAERKHNDNMNVSSAFESGFIKHNITVVERKSVDSEMKRMGVTAHELITKNSIHGIPFNLDAKVLVVGEYLLNFESDGVATDMQNMNKIISPEKVNFQTVHIKGFDLRTGTVVFDITVKHTTGGKKLHQTKFVAFVAKFLLDKIKENN